MRGRCGRGQRSRVGSRDGRKHRHCLAQGRHLGRQPSGLIPSEAAPTSLAARISPHRLHAPPPSAAPSFSPPPPRLPPPPPPPPPLLGGAGGGGGGRRHEGG